MENPCKEFELNDEKILILLKSLYGLSEGGDYLDHIFCKHLQTDLHMGTCISDPV